MKLAIVLIGFTGLLTTCGQTTTPTTTSSELSVAVSAPTGLKPEQDAVLIDQNAKKMKISDVFTTKYILMDFSQSGCGYCINLSGAMNKSKKKQKMLSGKDCKLVTVVPKNDLKNWLSVINGGDTFVGKNSYQVEKSLGAIAKPFGFNLTGTPTTLLIDANGKIVSSAVGEEPADLADYCKE